MGKIKAVLLTVLASAIPSVSSAGEDAVAGQGKRAAAAEASENSDPTAYQRVEPVYSGCQRHTVWTRTRFHMPPFPVRSACVDWWSAARGAGPHRLGGSTRSDR